MSRNIKLITGIPRSGTTLCCSLINQHEDAIALHEPIDPASLKAVKSNADALDNIEKQIQVLDHAVALGLPFNHGDKGGLGIENPVGLLAKDGVRQVVAKRGTLSLPARDPESYTLVVKQNALFTSLLPELTKHYQVICIVRNPVDVLLSWMTVDLPVNRGHIPAGERFDMQLKQSLLNKSVIEKQLTIYQWFISRFLNSGLPIVRYEDVITSCGVILDNALGFSEITREPLQKKHRAFSQDVRQQLERVMPSLLELDYGGLYNKEDIKRARADSG